MCQSLTCDHVSINVLAEDRGFGYLRVITGDELSKRVKFAFVTWCGNEVGGFQRAKLGTDKSALKQVVKVTG